MDSTNAVVTTEEQTNLSENSHKRIDILIETERYVIGIENKLGAGLYNPLDDYAKHIHAKQADQNVLLVVLSAHNILNPHEKRKMKENKFKFVHYKELFKEVRKLTGEYIFNCDNRHLVFMTDFIQTIENKMKIMENSKMNKFFSENQETVKTLIEEFNKWNGDIFNQQKDEISNIYNQLSSPSDNPKWWIYQGFDLGVKFNEGTDKLIGIESRFEQAYGNPLAEFRICFTTWKVGRITPQQCWAHYESEIKSKYPDCEIDTGSGNNENRVYYHLPVIKNDKFDEIIPKLKEYYQFLKDLKK